MKSRWPWALLAMLAVALVLPLLVGSDDYRMGLLNRIGVYAIATLGLSLVVGWLGELSFGHAGLMGLGAYTAGVLAVRFGVSLWLGMVAAALVCMAVGLVIGLPTLRLRASYFALATFGFNVILVQILNNISITGGAQGLKNIPPLFLGPWRLTGVSLYYLLVAVVAVAATLMRRLQSSSLGRALAAISEGPHVAAAMGIPVARYKTLAFVISAAFAGVAGALYAGWVQYLSPPTFGLRLSLDLVTMIIIGGAASIPGVLGGTALVVLLPELLRATRDYYLLIYGIGILVILVFLPDGLASLGQRLRLPALAAAVRRRRAQRQPPAAAAGPREGVGG